MFKSGPFRVSNDARYLRRKREENDVFQKLRSLEVSPEFWLSSVHPSSRGKIKWPDRQEITVCSRFLMDSHDWVHFSGQIRILTLPLRTENVYWNNTRTWFGI